MDTIKLKTMMTMRMEETEFAADEDEDEAGVAGVIYDICI